MLAATRRRSRLVMGVLVGAVLCSAAPVRAQNVNARLDQVIRFYADDRKSFMGTVLVARDGKPILSAGYGFANLEWSVPNAPGTKFRIGSLTGHFTAAAVLLLEQHGKLLLDDPLKKYLIDIPPAWGGITLQHLLADTSGVPDYSEAPEYRTARFSASTPDKLLALVRDRPLEFAPGERFDRSNSGYLLLGFAIEKAAGAPYQRFVREALLAPAGMVESGFEAGTAVVTRRASGYARSSAGFANADFTQMSASYAAGGLYSTSGDLLKWTQALFSGKILSAASLQKVMTTVRDHHALGVTVQTANNRRVVSGSGAVEGFAAVFDFYPGGRTTVIVLSNLEGTAAGEMAAQLGAVAHGDEVRLTYQRQEISVPVATLKRYVGTYELAPKVNLTIGFRGSQLTVQVTGQAVAPLFAEAEQRFFLRVVDAQIEFPADENGEVTYLIFHQNGRDLKAVRK